MEKTLDRIKELLIQKKYNEAYEFFASQNSSLLNSIQGLNLYGICVRGMGRPHNSIKAYVKSLSINSRQAGIWTNLGNSYKDINKLESSIECHHIANELTNGKDALILHNLGIAYCANNNHLQAIDSYKKALEVAPSKKEIYWDIARSQLALFDYKNGWKNYKARWTSPEAGQNKYEINYWKGEKIKNKIIFVFCDQGFGDYIQCFRFIENLVNESPAKIYLEVKKEMADLISQSINTSEIIELLPHSIEKQKVDYDYSVAITDLPVIYAKSYKTIISKFPYLTSNKNNNINKNIFANKKIKIGIVWTGSLTFKRNRQRSPDIKYFIDNLNLPQVQLYSLQKGEKVVELEKFKSEVIDLDPYISNYSDTANYLEELDIVVSMCTSVVHLCGALNKECWIALDYSSHWLWGVNEKSSHWYPSIKLFKQKAPGDWDSVFDNIQGELIKKIKRKISDDNI